MIAITPLGAGQRSPEETAFILKHADLAKILEALWSGRGDWWGSSPPTTIDELLSISQAGDWAQFAPLAAELTAWIRLHDA